MHQVYVQAGEKYHVKLRTDRADGFSLTEKAYRYGDHGIYIAIKEKCKRIFIALTDNNQYKRQIYIKLYPKKNSIEIKVPVNVTSRSMMTILTVWEYTPC